MSRRQTARCIETALRKTFEVNEEDKVKLSLQLTWDEDPAFVQAQFKLAIDAIDDRNEGSGGRVGEIQLQITYNLRNDHKAKVKAVSSVYVDGGVLEAVLSRLVSACEEECLRRFAERTEQMGQQLGLMAQEWGGTVSLGRGEDDEADAAREPVGVR